ncbi:MAG TPA: hypothetical protein VGJ73_19665 [Verrucomicrobiae bacterium]|jgi:hypothetical protein
MVGTRGPQTPTGFHAFFSTGVGGGVPLYVHANNGAALIILLGLWVGLQLFMYARARRARGIFIDERFGEFAWIGAGGFLFGLLLSSTLLVVIGK